MVYDTPHKLLAAVHSACDLLKRQHYQQAHSILLQVQDDADKAGRPGSPYVTWLRAICADHLGDFEDAVISIRQALQLDPLCPAVHDSLGIITRRVRSALHEAVDQGGGGPEVDGLYRSLKRLGEATALDDLMFARHLYQNDRHDEARDIINTVFAAAVDVETFGDLMERPLRLEDVKVEPNVFILPSAKA